MDSYKYEVAFSFLAQDEPLALELAGLLSERLTTFVYSKRQGEIAGTDGEATFNRVFGEESRLVVVLYRDGWGETPWTRIEQTAIRNRAFADGYDFSLFIVLEKATPPKWLPKAQIWYGFDHYGVEHIASTIEHLISQLGGTIHVETALQRAERLNREKSQEDDRLLFLGSTAGVTSAKSELESLFNSLESLAIKLSAAMPTSPVRTHREQTRFICNCAGIGLTIAWSQQWSNTLDHSALYFMTWNGEIPSIVLAPPDRIREEKYHFDKLSNGTLGWRSQSDSGRFFRTEDLSDHHLKQLLEDVASQGSPK